MAGPHVSTNAGGVVPKAVESEGACAEFEPKFVAASRQTPWAATAALGLREVASKFLEAGLCQWD